MVRQVANIMCHGGMGMCSLPTVFLQDGLLASISIHLLTNVVINVLFFVIVRVCHMGPCSTMNFEL